MKYKKYQHIEKLGSSEVEGILKGEVHLSYKIDGTNGCIYFENDAVKFGSRNRELTIDNDNCKVMNSVLQNNEYMSAIRTYLSRHPEHIIYGEWLVPVNIKRYKKDAWNKFYIFDIYDSCVEKYLRYDQYVPELIELGLSFIPEIVVLHDPTPEDISSYLEKTSEYLLDNGVGEGIVIKNYEYKNLYGRTTWAKILTEDFMHKKATGRKENSDNKNNTPIEYKIINLFLTPEHIMKEKEKIIERYGSWESEMTFELLNRCFLEFYKDNWEIILKKLHYPIINFNTLKKMCDIKVKEVAGL